MAKAHPAKKARFLAGCMGAAGFALTSMAILQDSLVSHEISSSFLQAPQSEPQPASINSEAFALQGSAAPAPAAPQSIESEPLEPSPAEVPSTVASTEAEQPAPKAEAASESDAESDAS